jgi:hypothetical protein
MTKKILEIDNSKGSPLWAFNRLRTDAFVMLMDDLVIAQKKGLNEPQCNQVKIALAQSTNCATALPDGSAIRRAIWKEMERFEDIYSKWNEPKGDEKAKQEHRKKHLRKLRSARHKLSRRVRKNGHILSNDLDLGVIDAAYDAIRDLVKLAPDIFQNLSKAIKRLDKGKI